MLLLTVAAQVGIAEVVGHDQNDIGRALVAGLRERSGEQASKSGGCAAAELQESSSTQHAMHGGVTHRRGRPVNLGCIRRGAAFSLGTY